MLRRMLYPFLLVITAFIWGTAFVAQSVGGKTIGAFTLNAARSFIGCLALVPCIMLLKALQKKNGGQDTLPSNSSGRQLLLGGIVCGLCLGLASMSQQYGIALTTVGKSGFLTALYIILVPMAGLLFGRKTSIVLLTSAAFALGGMYMLCFKNDGSGINAGDMWICLSAVLFTLHILCIDHFAPRVDCLKLSCIQFFMAGIISLIFALAFEKIVFADILACYGPILYLGVLSSGVAYTLQVIAQSRTHPVAATLIMSLESVFAALAGAVILGESMSLRELSGCTVIFTAVIMAQLPQKQNGEKVKQ